MPKGYIIAELAWISPGAESQEYGQKVPATIESFGGRYLVRGGDPKLLEGDHLQGRAVIIEFDSVDQAIAWYNSMEYQEILPLRLRNAATRVLCAAGT